MAQELPEPPVILVVEDDVLLRMVVVEELIDVGFAAVEARDAHEAVKIIENGVHLDVVLTDVKMPGKMDGLGLAKWIRENKPGMPVFVASGYTGSLRIASELFGGEEFIQKPYVVSLLAARMKSAIEARKDLS